MKRRTVVPEPTSPDDPFQDARGSALVRTRGAPVGPHWWDEIDPTAFAADDGSVWLY